MEIEQNYIDILQGILEESCQDGKIVSRNVLFSKFEREAKSGMEIYRFKKALSFLINKGIIAGYCIKTGRNGGVYKPEKVTVICSYGKIRGTCFQSRTLRAHFEP